LNKQTVEKLKTKQLELEEAKELLSNENSILKNQLYNYDKTILQLTQAKKGP